LTENGDADGAMVLGVDLGTGGCKVCAVGRDGRVAGTCTAVYETSTPKAGWAEQDPEDWLQALADATGSLLKQTSIRGGDVAGIALSSAAHIGVLLDESGRPARNAILWSDQRSQAEVDQLEETAGDAIFARTGNRISTTWTLPHLAWIARNDKNAWQRTRAILLSKDYVLYRLTGRRITDAATALSSMLYDAVEGDWSDPLCALVKITPEVLCEILPATAPAGALTPEAAGMLGLMPGTPVICGTLDSAAETYGAGVATPGSALVRLASAGGIHLVHDRMQPHPRLITYPHPIAPLWYSQAGTSTCATSVTWAIRAFTRGRGASFEEWDEEAGNVPPGSEGLMFHPYLAGERCPHWDGRLRASFVGATLRSTSGHFARAVYEGTAFSIRDSLRVLEEVAPLPASLTVVGGGARSKLWLRVVCDCLGRSLEIAGYADSSFGAALLGMVGLGWFKNPESALASVGECVEQIDPDDTNHRLYNELFDRYRDIHERLAPLYHHSPSQA
jgi:xylulokinase